MTLIELSRKERKLLEHLVRNTSDANTLRRVQALLWLDYGEDVEDVADQLYVSRLTVYKWVRQFKQRDRLDVMRLKKVQSWSGVAMGSGPAGV